MPLNDAVTKDLTASSQMMAMGSSPKMLYSAFVLGLIREFFSLVVGPTSDSLQIDNAFSCLVAFCPDKTARDRIWALYVERREQGVDRTNAAILSCGELVDYLSEALDLTESSEGSFL